MSPFTRTWELAPALIDYVSAAGEALKDALRDGRIRAHGLIVGVGEIDVDRLFWRFAEINPDGWAINLSSLQKLAWFEVNIEDVLKIWPPSAPPAETVETSSTQPTRKAVHKRELEPFVVEGKFASCDKAVDAARDRFVGRSINRDLIRKIWNNRGLGGKRGRPRKNSAEDSAARGPI
jgi:hypothetical protein